MMTRRDPYVNMLRATIAVFAASVGGADSITVLPHTAAIGLPDRFARRIARNTQLVLLEEASLARVTDPSAGSGSITALTQELCMAAWSLFQEIERAGGAWAALEAGLIQRNVAAVRAARMQAVAHGVDALIGTNAFPTLDEPPVTVLDVPRAALAVDGAVVVRAEPLPRLRLAEPFEALRDASDRMLAATGARPSVFLATLGPSAEFTPRATFAKNFFAAGGIESVEPGAVANPEAMIEAFQRAGTRLACLCGSDAAYGREAATVGLALRTAAAAHIYVAGRPSGAMMELAGELSFVYDGCDMLAMLERAHEMLGLPR
jgi:methylmalonyl-CoA mutase